MQRPSTVIRVSVDGIARPLEATTLEKLGKNEEFLEAVIERNPGLLQLENRRTGIRRPFKVFRQLSLPTPSGRLIYPDVVLLAASGHVIVVEVKLGINPELRNRSVIAQIVDYAASFSALNEQEIISMFRKDSVCESWDGLVANWFPLEPDVDELAAVLQNRMTSGELNLVIACDRIPVGLPDVISGIVTVRPLGFDLDLVEITPFVEVGSDELVFVPSTRLQTEIVSRTAVTVSYRATESKPEISVESSSAASIIDRVKGISDSRKWSIEEVEAAVEEDGNEIDKRLFLFAKMNSINGQCVSPAIKKTPTFGLTYLFSTDGKQSKKMLFWCVLGWDSLTLNLYHLTNAITPGIEIEFRNRLVQLFGENVDFQSTAPSIRYEYLEPVLADFLDLCLRLKDQMCV